MTSLRLLAALGSSFAAGPGILPYAEPTATRSERNYAHQLAALIGTELVDLTVSGATTANLVDTPQQMVDGTVLPPQVDGIPAEADLVTITAGGNDLQFAGAMLYLAVNRLVPESPILPILAPLFVDGIPAPTEEIVENATAGLTRVVETTQQKAPHARVLLVDYLTVLQRSSAAVVPFTDDELDRLLIIQDKIGLVFAGAAERTGAELVRASALSRGHALGSDDPWVQPFQQDLAKTPGSFHPNEVGMAAIAVELQRVLTV